MKAKIEAGAEFFQTQFCFDIGLVRRYMDRLDEEGILEESYFLIGIGPIPSVKSARWMNKNLYGVHIPDGIINRLENASDPQTESINICIELIQQLRGIKGVSGVHIMGPRVEKAAAQVIANTGIMKERE